MTDMSSGGDGLDLNNFLITIGSSSLVVAIFETFVGGTVNRQLVKLKHQFEIAQKNNELAFGALQQRRVDSVSSMFSSLCDVYDSLIALAEMHLNGSSNVSVEQEGEKLDRLNQDFKKLLARQRIFVTKNVAEALKETNNTLTRYMSKRKRSFSIAEESDDLTEEFKVWINEHRDMKMEVEEVLEILVTEVRKLLGADK